jgi:general secretion pathway protein M
MLEALLQRWHLLAARERRAVIGAAAVLLVAFVWLVLFEPAWLARSRLQAELPTLRSQLAQMEQLAGEARRLAALPATNDSPQSLKLQIESSIDSAGLRPALAQLSTNGSLFDLRFKRVAYAAWLDWLDTATRETRLRVADVAITRESGIGLVSVRLALETPSRDER